MGGGIRISFASEEYTGVRVVELIFHETEVDSLFFNNEYAFGIGLECVIPSGMGITRIFGMEGT